MQATTLAVQLPMMQVFDQHKSSQGCSCTGQAVLNEGHLVPFASMALRSCRVRRFGVSGANSSMTACTASMPVISTCTKRMLFDC